MYVFSQFYITNYVSVLALCIKLKLKLLKLPTSHIIMASASKKGFTQNYGAEFFSIGSLLRLLLRYTLHCLPACMPKRGRVELSQLSVE